jgi:flagellar biosynthesis/type III secretory pathway protein FliH
MEEGLEKGLEKGRAEGETAGEVRGRAALIARQLTLRFGSLGASERNRILAASIPELDAMGERLLTAHTLGEALGIA